MVHRAERRFGASFADGGTERAKDDGHVWNRSEEVQPGKIADHLFDGSGEDGKGAPKEGGGAIAEPAGEFVGNCAANEARGSGDQGNHSP